MKKNYTREELHRLMEQMRDEFQLVRLVEPLSRRVCDEKTLLTTDEVCHSVWDRLERCENCSSGRALSEGETFMKLEIIGDKTFLVVSKYLIADDRELILELVYNAPTNILLGSEQKSAVSHLIDSYNYLLMTDPLTGLFNRRYLDEKFAPFLDCRENRDAVLNVAMTDIDGFKEINDTYGHETGDVLLVSIARRLDEAVREQDTVARLGGDEFILLFEGLGGVEEAHSLAKRVDALFAEPFVAGGRPFLCSASAGLAVHRPGDGATAQEMLAIADMRMYEAKAQRKTRKAISGNRS